MSNRGTHGSSLFSARRRLGFVPPLVCWICGKHRWTFDGFARHMRGHRG